MAGEGNGNGNGMKLPGFGFKEVMTLLVLIFGIGGTWTTLNYRVSAQEQAVNAVTQQSNADSKKIIEVQKDVESIKEKVGDIAAKQDAQQQLLTTILLEVQKRK